MAQCPSCGRPVAMARPRCLYCGGALDESLVTEAAKSAAAALAPPVPAPGPARTLVVIGLDRATKTALGQGLGLGEFEAQQRMKRGGYALEIILEDEEARAEAKRLQAAGLEVVLVPEAEARRPCWTASGGSWDGVLRLQGDGDKREIPAGDVLLVVRGPIAREYQAPDKRRKFDTARLDAGYRFHLHLRQDAVAVEIDPADFAFTAGAPLQGSSQAEIHSWMDAVRAGSPEDDAFRHVTPALGLRKDEAGSRVLPGLPHASERARAPQSVLDNLAQFRFYSAWRAAVERRVPR